MAKKFDTEKYKNEERISIEKASEYEEIDFSLFQNATVMWIGSKSAYHIPKSIISMKKLEKLCIGENCILPDAIFQLKSLKELWLDGETIYNVPQTITKALSIETLYIGYYEREFSPKDAPSWIFQMENLKELIFLVSKFSNYNFENHNLKHLTTLDFGCSLSDLTCFPDLSSLKTLKKLTVTGESVQGQKVAKYRLFPQIIESIKDLTQLEELDISSWKPRKKADWIFDENGKKTLPDIFNYPKLEKLWLHDMGLEVLPKSFLGLKNLKEFYFNNNNFSNDYVRELINHFPNCKMEGDFGFYKPKKNKR